MTMVFPSPALPLSRSPALSLSRSLALQLLNIPRMRLNLPTLHAFHHLGECRVGRRWNTYFLALGSHQAIEKIDLGAAALEHVLPGGRTSLLGHALQAIQHDALNFLQRCWIALCGRHLAAMTPPVGWLVDDERLTALASRPS